MLSLLVVCLVIGFVCGFLVCRDDRDEWRDRAETNTELLADAERLLERYEDIGLGEDALVAIERAHDLHKIGGLLGTAAAIRSLVRSTRQN